MHAPNVADVYPSFQPEDALIICASTTSDTTGNRRSIAREEPSKALLLFLEDANDGLFKQIDVKFADEDIPTDGKDVKHLQGTQARHWVALPVADALHQVLGNALERTFSTVGAGSTRIVLLLSAHVIRRRRRGREGVGHRRRLRGIIARRRALDVRFIADSSRRGIGMVGWACELGNNPTRRAIASAWLGVLPSRGQFDEDNARQGLDGCRCAVDVWEFGADGDRGRNDVLAL